MHFSLPHCKRCCFCMPLRHGILIFGFLNLLFNLLLLTREVLLDIRHGFHGFGSTVVFRYRGVSMYTGLWFTYSLYALDIIFSIFLLVGVYRKNTRVLCVYYYYGIFTTLTALLTYLVTRRYNYSQDWMYDHLEFCLAFSLIILQCYLLLLIRTELNKLKNLGDPVRYVNHMAEVVVEPLPPGDGNQQQ